MDVFPLDIFAFQQQKKKDQMKIFRSIRNSKQLIVSLVEHTRSGQYFEPIKCLLWFSDKSRKHLPPRSPTLADIQDVSVMPTCEKTVIQHHVSDAGGGRDRQRPRVKEKKAIPVPPLRNHFSFSYDDSMHV